MGGKNVSPIGEGLRSLVGKSRRKGEKKNRVKRPSGAGKKLRAKKK